ncbi:carbon-nitrogen hydrolase [Nitzschia inconspicua]|uniref:Carbon-nitrogen hydrolase n=1 Tax=Nitzschia inconspicua TaxID=303405 RepID=A0A9K3L983_9STRA|nr:carbon-nitrogen hydrolase [Nitzschia inconspicua]
MKEQLTVGLVQPELRRSDETPMEATRRICEMMVTEPSGIDLFVLPELCPVGYSEDTFFRYLPETSELRSLYGEIDNEMAEAARKCGACICYGTIGWEEEEYRQSNNGSLTPSNNT